ncbi:hypothetical protein GKZ90_0022040 [Flavobacterium sp. MC2016-06]|jgi:hypothetical protein|uniref:hypothetical protein n=1 Tax=Flavobacterium sp. MC2016-06 TaxID=2676308 RepID=UPI0012BA6AF8|nr:hypothetical protein [Flavobacterium sp. MC2016-06]MBU3861112.1 hypothetical protein [Flavobacterium sp. MC2016-06]
MNKLLPFLLLLLLGCDSKNCQKTIRETEAINLLKDLIEQDGSNLVSDFPSSKDLPICLNLKKIIIETDCFKEPTRPAKIIKPPKRSFTNQGKICIEFFNKSRQMKSYFFSKKDSLNFINQNECIYKLLIPKSITKNFKTVQRTKTIDITEEYIQFSFPIFSSDNTKAYLEYDHHSKNESYGYSFYLEKINKKWKVKYFATSWAI